MLEEKRGNGTALEERKHLSSGLRGTYQLPRAKLPGHHVLPLLPCADPASFLRACQVLGEEVQLEGSSRVEQKKVLQEPHLWSSLISSGTLILQSQEANLDCLCLHMSPSPKAGPHRSCVCCSLNLHVADRARRKQALGSLHTRSLEQGGSTLMT